MKIKQEFIRLNTVLLPEGELLQVALKLAKKVSKDNEVLYFLDNVRYIPHLTIYAPEYPSKNLNKILSSVGNIAKKISPVPLKFEKYYYGEGWIGLGFRKTTEVKKLHELILRGLNPLREGRLRIKYEAELADGKYNTTQKKYINEYGYQNVLKNYHPHLSIARFEDFARAKEVCNLLPQSLVPVNAVVTKLGVGISGEHGTVTEMIKTFNLK